MEVVDRAQQPDSLVDEAVGESSGAVTSNADDSAGKAGVENVHEGGEGGTDDLAGCVHCVVQGLPAGGRAGSRPHSDATSEDALNSATVEGADIKFFF